jgi:hypothetical protein
MMIPEVMIAIAKIGRQLELVRREEPTWPPLQQHQEARRRSAQAMVAACDAMCLEPIEASIALEAREGAAPCTASPPFAATPLRRVVRSPGC